MAGVSPASDDDRLPSVELRTALSLLILLHLFSLFVAVATNFGPVSPFRGAFGQVPFIKPYLQGLYMDLAYNFHLTYGDQMDVDHILEMDWESKDGSFRSVSLVLPPTDLGNGIRRRRYQQLALNLLTQAENPDPNRSATAEAILPRAVAGSALAENEQNSLVLRARAHWLVSQEEAGSSDATTTDPSSDRRYGERYKARLWRDGNGQLQMMKIEGPASGAGASGPVESAPPPMRRPEGQTP
jgi:hypothetical protein